MPDWRKTAKTFALGDGHISEKEVGMLRQEFFKDGKISQSELNFLHEIKKDAKTTVKVLDSLIEECEKSIGN